MRRLILTVLLLAAAFGARAADYTDLWFNPTEQSTGGGGWGVNVVQSDAFVFVTFFIYGPDNKPTWYVANLTQDASGNFNGPLYATTGTYFAAPWNPADGAGSAQVGTASFQPISAYAATLTYAFNGGPTVVKPIQRQALTSIALGGAYSGTQAGSYTNCTNSFAYSDRFNLGVTHITGTSLTFSFNYSDSGLSCTLSGQLQQLGQLYRIPAATYQCSDGSPATTATVDQIKATTFGIEGSFNAPNVAGCQEDATFSAVFLPPI